MSQYKANTWIMESLGKFLSMDSTPKLSINDLKSSNSIGRLFKFKTKLIWPNIIGISVLHILAVYGYIAFWFHGRISTALFALVVGGIGGFGVTAGAHRLWCHRAYKANLPLRIILMICYTIAGQNTLYEWVRDHQVHHKFTETDADPHNSNRGFFFAHVGWLMMKKHPEVIEKGQGIDMTDIDRDAVVQFHLKYFKSMKLIFCFILPTAIPVYCWGEKWLWSFMSMAVCRYASNLNCTWFVNSLAHISGSKPYDKRISPVENKTVSFLAMGEGWHNYHHTFPWDYKAAELGEYSLNVTTMWLDFFARIGWAYDLRQPSQRMVRRMLQTNGDGSHLYHHEVEPISNVID